MKSRIVILQSRNHHHVDQRAPRRDARNPRRDDARECEVARGTHRGRRGTSRRASLATMSAASALAFAPTPRGARAARARRVLPSPAVAPRRSSSRQLASSSPFSPRGRHLRGRRSDPPRGLGLCPSRHRSRGREPPRRRPPRGRLGRGRRERLPRHPPRLRARFPSLRARGPRRRRFPHESPLRPHHPRTLVVPSVDRRGGAHPRGGWGAGAEPHGPRHVVVGQPVRVGIRRIHGPRTPRRVQPRRRRGHQHLRHRGQLRHWKRFRRTFGGVARRISARVSRSRQGVARQHRH